MWARALKKTEIIRSRVQALGTFEDTPVPYIFLAESAINVQDTVIRTGEVLVRRPSIILPPNIPQFEGFDFEGEGVRENSIVNFLLVRGVTLPSFKYDNKTHAIDIFEGRLADAITHYKNLLQQKENVRTGLIAGPGDCWPFSILIFICSQIVRNADTDIGKLMDEYKRRQEGK